MTEKPTVELEGPETDHFGITVAKQKFRDRDGDCAMMLFTTFDQETGKLTISVYNYDEKPALELLQFDASAGLVKVRVK